MKPGCILFLYKKFKPGVRMMATPWVRWGTPTSAHNRARAKGKVGLSSSHNHQHLHRHCRFFATFLSLAPIPCRYWRPTSWRSTWACQLASSLDPSLRPPCSSLSIPDRRFYSPDHMACHMNSPISISGSCPDHLSLDELLMPWLECS